MWIFCGGGHRSGSTLQFQLAASIVEAAGLGWRVPWTIPEDMDSVFDNYQWPGISIVKSHVPVPRIIDCVEDGFGRALYIHRDLRDVAVSTMFKHKIPFSSVMESDTLPNAIKWGALWEGLPGVLTQRYDETIANIPGAVDQICDYLGIELTLVDRGAIANNHSVDNQKKLISKIPADLDWDENELLHHNHIGRLNGQVGQWRTILATFQVQQIESLYGGWLVEHGYELNE